ncbi:MAG: ribulose-phosphate 3-epimerase [Planctomycetota bacterium]|nr:MAG: ribulose-phosphate 3-epimerase [Planctomycetota bacterium]
MNASASLAALRPQLPVIAPSMLKCDFGNLRREIELLDRATSSVLHWDVMDGHFVPNLSYGALLIERVRPLTRALFDAHLMISDPARYLDDYIRAGCEIITFHIEAVPEPVELLRRIRQAGCLAGLAVNPKTPVSAVRSAVGECDNVLIMSVEPGFGGQAFIPGAIEKVAEARAMFGPEVLISIDGGIGPKTISEPAKAGVDLFVAGSSVFDLPDYGQAIQSMAALARSARNVS